MSKALCIVTARCRDDAVLYARAWRRRHIHLREAQVVIEGWRRHYNAVRPHASLGYRAPAPEVFVPALAMGTPAPSRPASLAIPAVAPRPVMH